MTGIDVLREGFLNFEEKWYFLRPYRTIKARMVRDSSKHHKLISGDDEKKILTKKIFFDPFLANFRFWAIWEKCYFGIYVVF